MRFVMICVASCAALIAPLGFALLRLSARRLVISDLALAIGLGCSVAPVLILLELWTGIGGLLLVASLAALLVVVRSEWERPTLREVVGLLALPAAALLLAYGMTADDMRFEGPRASFRLGFDSSDRAFYAMVATEVERAPPPRSQNPLFADTPLAYTVYPALFGVIADRYAGVPVEIFYMKCLFALGLAFTALAADRLLRSFPELTGGTRALTVTLLLTGGGFEILFSPDNPTAYERHRFMSLFLVNTSEWLFFNTWVLAAPLMWCLLCVAVRWLREGKRSDLLLAALLAGAMLQTKVFLAITLGGGIGIAVLALRSRRLFVLAAALAAGMVPGLLLTKIQSAGAEMALAVAPTFLLPVRRFLGQVPALAGLRELAAADNALVSAAALGGALILYLFGLFGVRLIGFILLYRLRQSADREIHVSIAASCLFGLVLGMTTVTAPLWYDAAEFWMVPLAVSWLYAGPLLANALRHPRIRAAALAAILVSPASFLYYAAAKKFPAAVVPKSANDAQRQQFSADDLAACRWLRSHARSGGRLAFPLYGDSDPTGIRSVFASMMSGQRLVASRLVFHIPLHRAQEVGGDLATLYSTEQATEMAAVLAERDVEWVWEDRGLPLRARPAGLSLAWTSPTVNLYRRQPPSFAP